MIQDEGRGRRNRSPPAHVSESSSHTPQPISRRGRKQSALSHFHRRQVRSSVPRAPTPQNDQATFVSPSCTGMGPHESWHRFYAADHISSIDRETRSAARRCGAVRGGRPRTKNARASASGCSGAERHQERGEERLLLRRPGGGGGGGGGEGEGAC